MKAKNLILSLFLITSVVNADINFDKFKAASSDLWDATVDIAKDIKREYISDNNETEDSLEKNTSVSVKKKTLRDISKEIDETSKKENPSFFSKEGLIEFFRPKEKE